MLHSTFSPGKASLGTQVQSSVQAVTHGIHPHPCFLYWQHEEGKSKSPCA